MLRLWENLGRLPVVDFHNIESFLTSLLLETGCPTSEVKDGRSSTDLKRLALEHLSSYRYLVVIDDVDTLDDEVCSKKYCT